MTSARNHTNPNVTAAIARGTQGAAQVLTLAGVRPAFRLLSTTRVR
jgi:hypothetical protein